VLPRGARRGGTAAGIALEGGWSTKTKTKEFATAFKEARTKALSHALGRLQAVTVGVLRALYVSGPKLWDGFWEQPHRAAA
jgi:hypothetical protein